MRIVHRHKIPVPLIFYHHIPNTVGQPNPKAYLYKKMVFSLHNWKINLIRLMISWGISKSNWITVCFVLSTLPIINVCSLPGGGGFKESEQKLTVVGEF